MIVETLHLLQIRIGRDYKIPIFRLNAFYVT